MSDRTVHAAYKDMEIVRYNRAGAWYLEPTIPGLPRQRVAIAQAVAAALWGKENAGGVVAIGQPGGTTFDRLVLAAAGSAGNTEAEA